MTTIRAEKIRRLITTLVLTVLVVVVSGIEESANNSRQSNQQQQQQQQQQRRLNVTSILGKQARLPCFVQSGRKFIWMQSNRDEILSIDSNVITGDSRFGVEHTNRCRSSGSGSSSRRALPESSAYNQTDSHRFGDDLNIVDDSSTSVDGCWVYLSINSVSLYDEGLYVCQIDTMTSTLVTLNILVPPFLKKPSTLYRSGVGGGSRNRLIYSQSQSEETSLSIDEGKSLEINCGATGKPEPTVKWYSFKYPNPNSYFIKSGPVLRIKNATKHSTKKYECIADNGVNPSLSRTFTITVNFAPQIKHLDVNNCRESKLNDELDLDHIRVNCHVSSSPKARIKWRYDGSELDGRFAYEINEITTKSSNIVSRLVIKNMTVTSQLNGSFECIAENRLKSVNSSVRICPKLIDLYRRVKESTNNEGGEFEENNSIVSNHHPHHRNFKLRVGDKTVLDQDHRNNGTLLKEIILFDKKRTAVFNTDYHNHTKVFDLGLLVNNVGEQTKKSIFLVYFLSMFYYFLMLFVS